MTLVNLILEMIMEKIPNSGTAYCMKLITSLLPFSGGEAETEEIKRKSY